jgi:tetratricopeptide (TPR) repeat protein
MLSSARYNQRPALLRHLVLLGAVSLIACALPVLSVKANTESSCLDLQKRGTEALDANRYWLAEPLLKQAVMESEKLGFNHPYLAKSLGELGRYYSVRGRFSEAEPFLERELAVKETMLDKDGGQTIEAMGSLIKFYLAYGTASKADPLGADVLAFVEGKAREPREMEQKKVNAKDAPLVGWLGTAGANERNPIIEWAITCDSIAAAYKYKGKYDMAEKLYKAALDLKARVLGEGHLSLAGSYDSLGILCMERGEYKDAESYFRDALTTTEKTLTPDYPEVYARLDRLAKCLIKEKKYSEAEGLYKLALNTFWTKSPSKGGDEARAVFALGMLNMEQGKYGAAAPYFRRSLAMAEKFSGRSSLGLYPHLQNYAYCLYHLGARGECSRLRARANFIAGDFYKKPELEKKIAEDAKPSGKKKLASAGKRTPKYGGSASRNGRRRHRRHR